MRKDDEEVQSPLKKSKDPPAGAKGDVGAAVS